MKNNKGFTLIELLVVIAIIGILASVVLASLSSARNKGKDAAVKSQLSSMRAQAELYNAKVGNYTGVCTATADESGLAGLLSAAKDSGIFPTTTVVTASVTPGAYNMTTCHESADGLSWAVESPLSDSVSAIPAMHCVDSKGASKANATVFAADAAAC